MPENPSPHSPVHESGAATDDDRRGEWVREAIEELHEEFSALDEGAVADYIPELAHADPASFAIAVATTDGRRVSVGDATRPFTIQSISKLLLYGYALETHGRDGVLERVGVAPTGDTFNAIVLDDHENRAPNPMVNAGAIAITDLVPGDGIDERVEAVRSLFERYLGRRPEIDHEVWSSERATGNRNRAIAYLMLSRGIVGVIPGVGGLATFSPPLDDFGNSVRGLRVFEALSERFSLHLFDPSRPWSRPDPPSR